MIAQPPPGGWSSPAEKASMAEVHTNKRYYYVSVLDAKRKGLLLGPYDTHQEALDNVSRGRELAEQADAWAWGYAFGTAGSDVIVKTVFGR
jgi:hypothetical protein